MIGKPPAGHPDGMEPESVRVRAFSGAPKPGGSSVAEAGGPAAGVGGPPPERTPADDARLRRMVDAHFDFVWRSLRRLGMSESDADDGAQQVFLVASRRLAEIEVHAERSFLFGTAMRVASDARRARTRRREVADEDAGDAADPSLDPEQAADRSRARAMLDLVLDAMPMDLRAPFVLFEIEELPTAEIATMLGVPVGTVASRLRRARDEFHAIVARMKARDGFAVTQAAGTPGAGARAGHARDHDKPGGKR